MTGSAASLANNSTFAASRRAASLAVRDGSPDQLRDAVRWYRDHDRLRCGDEVTMADLFLIPQCYAAGRFEVELEKEFPKLAGIYSEALKTPACHATHPDRYQPT